MNQDQVSGILSNWSTIEADIQAGIDTDYGKSKNVQDILKIIDELQNEANTVSPLREMFTSHVANKQNPHDVVVSINDLDILNTLYTLYTEQFGNTMTFSDFSYALINVKRFATHADVDNNINSDSLVNVDVMTYLVGEHNVSPNAHADLFRTKVPGLPPQTPSASTYDPSVTAVNSFMVDRACPINYHDINGRVKSSPANTLPIDYLYGIPGTAIFGEHQNIMLNSCALADISFIGSTKVVDPTLLIVSPINDTAFVMLNENPTNGVHGFRDRFFTVLSGINNYSIYVYPLDRNQFVISLNDFALGVVSQTLFDTNTGTTETTGSITAINANVLKLASGWVRLTLGFDVGLLNIVSTDVLMLDKVDADNNFNTTYQGNGCNGAAFWQHQLTATALPAPPIFTTNMPGVVLGTKVTQDYSTLFNAIHGTFMIKYLSPLSEIFGKPSAILRLGNNDDPSNLATSIRIGSNLNNPAENQITAYNQQGGILELIDSNPYSASNPAFLKRVVFTYTLGFEGYGFTNQPPVVFEMAGDDAENEMTTFFTEMYDGSLGFVGTKILQLPDEDISLTSTDQGSLETGAFTTTDQLVAGAISNTPQYRINTNVNVLEIGYDSTSNLYLNGYLLCLKYYTNFSSEMNIEFLLNQYIPTT